MQLTPKEYLSLLDFCAALTAHRPTAREMMSFNYSPVSLRREFMPSVGMGSVLYHVECIRHQRQRPDSQSDTQLQSKEARINHQHDDDTRRLGHPHPGGCGKLALSFSSETLPVFLALTGYDVVWRRRCRQWCSLSLSWIGKQICIL